METYPSNIHRKNIHAQTNTTTTKTNPAYQHYTTTKNTQNPRATP